MNDFPPRIIAEALVHYENEEKAFIKLHWLIDTFELSVRLLCSVALCGLDKSPTRIVKEVLCKHLKQPSLGGWMNILREVVSDTGPLGLQLKRFYAEQMAPITGSGKRQKTNLIAVRNKVAHGGFLSDKTANEYLARAQPVFEEFMEQFRTLFEGIKFCYSPPAVKLHKTGEEPLTLRPFHVFTKIVRRFDGQDTPGATDESLLYSSIENGRFAQMTSVNDGLWQDEVLCKELLQRFPLNEWKIPINEWEKEEKKYDFSSLQGDLTRRFYGREAVVQELKAWLQSGKLDETEHDYLFLHGKSGIGKSAVIATVGQEMEDSCPEYKIFSYYFRAKDSRANLHAMLEAFCLFARSGEPVPSKPEDREARFWKDLERLARDFHVVVLLDGLDEAVANGDKRVCDFAFETRISGVRWLLGGNDSLKTKIPESCARRELGKLDNSAVGQLILNSVEKYRALGELPEKREKLIQKIQDSTEGNPRYLSLLLGEIACGARTFTEEGLSELPEGLNGYYHVHLQSVGVIAGSQENKALYFALAWAAKPLTIGEIAALTIDHLCPRGVSPREWEQALDRAQLDCADMVQCEYLQSNPYYSLDHHSLRQYFREPDSPMRDELRKFLRHLCKLALAANNQLADAHDAMGTDRLHLLRYAITYHLLARKTLDDDRRIAGGSTEAIRLRYAEVDAGIEALLTNFRYIQQRCAAGDVYALLDDFNRALDSWHGYSRYSAYRPYLVPKAEQDQILAELGEKGPWPHHGSHEEVVLRMKFAQKCCDEQRDLFAEELEKESWGRVELFYEFVREHSSVIAHANTSPTVVVEAAQGRARLGLVARAADACIAEWDQEARVHLNRPLAQRAPFVFTRPAILLAIPISGSISHVAITPNGKWALCAHLDSSITVWDLSTGKCLADWGPDWKGRHHKVQMVKVSPDGKRAASGGGDAELRFLDLLTYECLHLRRASRRTRDVRFSPDSMYVLSIGDYAEVWQFGDGERLAQIDTKERYIVAATFTADGKNIVSANSDNTITVWDLYGHQIFQLHGHRQQVTAIELAKKRGYVITASDDKTFRIWDLHDRKQVATIDGYKGHNPHPVLAIYPTDDGFVGTSRGFKQFASADSWSVPEGKHLLKVERYTALTERIEVTFDGKRMVSSDTGSAIGAWDIGSCSLQAPGARLNCATSPDRPGRLRAIWGPLQKDNARALTPDGKRVVSCSYDSILRVWDIESGQCWQPTEFERIEKEFGPATVVALTPDRRHAVSDCDSDFSLRVWDVTTGDCVRTLPNVCPQRRSSLAITASGERVLSTNDNCVVVSTLQNGENLKTLKGHLGEVTNVASLPGDSRGVSASRDKTVKIWDINTGACIQTFRGHKSAVLQMAVAPDGVSVLSHYENGLLKLWNVSSGRCRWTVEEPGAGLSYWRSRLLVTPCGTRALVARCDVIDLIDLRDGSVLDKWSGDHPLFFSDEVQATLSGCELHVSTAEMKDKYHFFLQGVRDMQAVTPTQFRIAYIDESAVKFAELKLYGDEQLSAAFATIIATNGEGYYFCPWCGVKSKPVAGVVEALRGIKRECPSAFAKGASPCLDLPVRFWNTEVLRQDGTGGHKCASCRNPIRFHPFEVRSSLNKYLVPDTASKRTTAANRARAKPAKSRAARAVKGDAKKR